MTLFSTSHKHTYVYIHVCIRISSDIEKSMTGPRLSGNLEARLAQRRRLLSRCQRP